MKMALPIFFAAVLLSFLACQREQSLAPGENVSLQPTFTSIQKNILTPSCVNRGCHPPVGPMSLQEGVAYNNLVNQPSAYGIPRVDPGNAENSALYLKVLGDVRVGGVQARMPLGAGSLTTDEINAIRDWINDGAKNN
ncbi:MAG: hypothetical protein D6814_14315 [Calditrichaeota bacterium]|nr:MAG: hypothetical protein D6814_14315 [Calditrichota bacterium]